MYFGVASAAARPNPFVPSLVSRSQLAIAAVLAFVVGLAMPLTDPDLGLHLRLGEWIVTHGAVPRTEPFAWTRAGAPYFAYSWLADVAYYRTLAALGPWGLHGLQGLSTLAAAAAAWSFARTLRLAAFPTMLLVATHLLVMLLVATALRPQSVLSIALPACWAAAVRLTDDSALGTSAWPYVTLFLAAAVAANVHLLAPLCLAPLALLVPTDGVRVRTTLTAVAATVAGLLATPYALAWRAMLRLNFAENALFRFPSPIAEHQPGFVHAARAADMVLVLAIALAVLPWALPRPVWPRRAPGALLALGWLAGLVMFAIAARALLVWWLAVLPLTAAALRRLPAPSPTPVGRLLAAMPAVLIAVLAARGGISTLETRSREGTVQHRTIAAPGAAAAMALSDTLDALAPNAHGHVLTSFDYGNALTWRLPRYSMSIDGRTIFPDSAAAAEGFLVGRAMPDSLPWVGGSAEIAILPMSHAFNRRLSRSAEWIRLADARVHATAAASDSGVLWARRTWLARYTPRANDLGLRSLKSSSTR